MDLCHLIVKNTWWNISSDLTNFLIELRQEILCERSIKIISPRRASPLNRVSSPLYEQPLNLVEHIYYPVSKMSET